MRLFIKDIKDTALDRNRSTPHITNKSTSNHRNLHRRLQHTRDTTNNGCSFSQRPGPAASLQGPSPITPLYTSAPPPQDYNPTAPNYITPPLPPLQGPSPITLLYTSAPPPQDHNPTAPHYASPLQRPELQFILQYGWQQQQQHLQPAQTWVQSPAQRDSYAAVAARLNTSPTELSLKRHCNTTPY